jgi:hypothetical protein
MLSEVSQVQKDKSHIDFLRINVCTNTNMTIYAYIEHVCNNGTVWRERGEKEEEKRMIESE